jgi:hypothetical protein
MPPATPILLKEKGKRLLRLGGYKTAIMPKLVAIWSAVGSCSGPGPVHLRRLLMRLKRVFPSALVDTKVSIDTIV